MLGHLPPLGRCALIACAIAPLLAGCGPLPDYVYERSAVAKLNSATSAPPPRPINAPPVREPSTFLLDPLVK